MWNIMGTARPKELFSELLQFTINWFITSQIVFRHYWQFIDVCLKESDFYIYDVQWSMSTNKFNCVRDLYR